MAARLKVSSESFSPSNETPVPSGPPPTFYTTRKMKLGGGEGGRRGDLRENAKKGERG
jgi:hypothetical protein